MTTSDAIDRAAMALMDKMSADRHEVNYAQCREYAALVIAAMRLRADRIEGGDR